MPHKPGFGAIFGIVSEDGLSKEGSPVYLYDMQRDIGVGTQRLLAVQHTRADGGFAFAGLDTAYSDYMLVASDEDGDPAKNALVQDRIQPIPAHQGDTWFNNWWLTACRFNALSIIAAYPVLGEGAGAWRVPAIDGLVQDLGIFEDGLAHASVTSIGFVPSAPQYGKIELQSGGSIAAPTRALTHRGGQNYTTTPNFSVELYVDLDSITGDDFVCGCMADFPLSLSRKLAVQYEVSETDGLGADARFSLVITPTKQIAVHVATSSTSSFIHPLFDEPSAVAEPISVLQHDAAALSGAVHVVATSTPFVTRLYIDGQLVASETHTHDVARPVFRRDSTTQEYSNRVLHALGGWSASGGARADVGCAAIYPSALSAAEVAALYDVIHDEQLPVASGQLRELINHTPTLLYALGQPVTSADSLLYPELSSKTAAANALGQALHLSAVSLAGAPTITDSPVASHAAHEFFGTNYWTSYCAGPVGLVDEKQAAFSCWVKLSSGTPPADEVFLGLLEPDQRPSNPVRYPTLDYSVPNMFSVGRDVGGNFFVMVGSTKHVFSGYTPPADQWLFVTINLDFRAELLQLYVGTELDTPTLQASISSGGALLTAYTRPFSAINGYSVTTNLDLGRGFSGALAFLALFPAALTVSELTAIWDAKDSI